MEKYNHRVVEEKWQKFWEDKKMYRAEDFSKKPKFYCLVEFPYPSGVGLHVGHVRSYSALDAVCRKKRMEGYNVLYPMGWDAFGLPTENYAVKTGRPPQEVTRENIINFRKQLKALGLSFDWSREINTTDSKYYKWTQWIFLQLFKKGLAYQAEMPVNWCPSCKIGLANEEVVAGRCERCGEESGKKIRKQWLLKITQYAERLLKDLREIDYLEKIKLQQINWIGRSEGIEIDFSGIKVFTTRPDTILGATFIVLSPDHPEARVEVESKYGQEKIGRFNGNYVVNPMTKEKIPVWVSDYVLMEYGTGAIMGVPAYDERDRDFAERYCLEVREAGLINSEKVPGKKSINYKLRDWIFSRQRYWGEPIPLIHCPRCGVVPVPEEDLPVELPEIGVYQPTEGGDSPLARIEAWVGTKCPECGEEARRETDVMPNWAGSSWYFLRYIDPKNNQALADKEKLKYWLSVDLYNGGMEHTTLHLLYSRFWHKFLFDLGVVPTAEPYERRRSHGMVLASDGQKMSKSKGNVISPDELVTYYGADALRLYEMFMGPFSKAIPWSTEGLVGMRRFLDKVWKLSPQKKDNSLRHQTIKKISGDIDSLKFNTALAILMEYVNSREYDYEILLKLLTPFAPHLTEELWGRLGYKSSIQLEAWPKYDESKIKSEEIIFVIQVNGKKKGTVEASRGQSKEQVLRKLQTIEKFSQLKPKRVVFVPDRLINLVI